MPLLGEIDMTLDVLSFMFGAILVAVAAIGGGLTLKDSKVPKLGTQGKVALFSFGAVLMAFSLWLRADSGNGEKTFNQPKFEGDFLDVCLVYAGDCGGHAASRWCRLQGYSTAADYDVDANAGARHLKTKTIQNNDVCEGDFCSTYRTITCKK
jgi:hypothetical protein